jgi:pyruvate formate lyase activating enzyme
MNDARHVEYTGVSNAPIIENLELLGQFHDNIWIRVPVIPGVNDGRDQLEEMARFVAAVPGVRQVNLLPYHSTGKMKFQRLGQTYPMADLQPPSAAHMAAAVSIFKAFGLKAKAGG